MPAGALRPDPRPLERQLRAASRGGGARLERAHRAHLAPVPRGLRPRLRAGLDVDLPGARHAPVTPRLPHASADAGLDVAPRPVGRLSDGGTGARRRIPTPVECAPCPSIPIATSLSLSCRPTFPACSSACTPTA